MSRGEAMTSTPRPELRGIALRLSTDHDGAEPAPLLRSSAGSACAAPVCGPRAPAEKYGTPSAQRWVHVRIAALHEGELRKAHMGRSSRLFPLYRSAESHRRQKTSDAAVTPPLAPSIPYCRRKVRGLRAIRGRRNRLPQLPGLRLRAKFAAPSRARSSAPCSVLRRLCAPAPSPRWAARTRRA